MLMLEAAVIQPQRELKLTNQTVEIIIHAFDNKGSL